MSYSTEKVTKNTSYFTLALIAQKIISFGYFSYLAYKLGATTLGTYTFALSFTTIFSVFADIGLANVVTREIAKYKDKISQVLGAVLSIKIPLSILTYLAVVIIINLMGLPQATMELVYISGLIMFLDSFTLTFYSIFRGTQILSYESIGTVIYQAVVAAIGIFLVSVTHDPRIVILAVLGASLFNFLYSLIFLIKKIQPKQVFKIDKELRLLIIKITIPFALAAIFTKVYGYLDTVLLHQFIGPEAVGYYSIPYKMTFALQFIPMAFVASLYPAFASYFMIDKEKLRITFHKAMVYLFMIGWPVTMGIMALADKIILKVYSAQYAPSILPLEILVFSIPLLFLNFPLGSLLNACNRQTRNTVHIGIVMIVNVILNLFLIPEFQVVGAALASTLSTALMFLLQYYVARQITIVKWKILIVDFGKILLAGLIMSAVILWLKSSINFIILIPLGAIIYTVLILAFKSLTTGELIILKNSVLNKVH